MCENKENQLFMHNSTLRRTSQSKQELQTEYKANFQFHEIPQKMKTN